MCHASIRKLLIQRIFSICNRLLKRLSAESCAKIAPQVSGASKPQDFRHDSMKFLHGRSLPVSRRFYRSCPSNDRAASKRCSEEQRTPVLGEAGTAAAFIAIVRVRVTKSEIQPREKTQRCGRRGTPVCGLGALGGAGGVGAAQSRELVVPVESSDGGGESRRERVRDASRRPFRLHDAEVLAGLERRRIAG